MIVKMKPLKVAQSGIPDLWTESVENGYYIVPYYFLDEKDNEHTVTVYESHVSSHRVQFSKMSKFSNWI